MDFPGLGKEEGVAQLKDGTFLISNPQTQGVVTHLSYPSPWSQMKSALSTCFLTVFAYLRYLPAAIAFQNSFCSCSTSSARNS